MKDLEVIKNLMEELQDQMKYSDEDLSERLGRKKPEVKVLEIKGKIPMDEESMEDESLEDKLGFDMDHDDEMDEDHEVSPDSDLKQRIMSLRKK